MRQIAVLMPAHETALLSIRRQTFRPGTLALNQVVDTGIVGRLTQRFWAHEGMKQDCRAGGKRVVPGVWLRFDRLTPPGCRGFLRPGTGALRNKKPLPDWPEGVVKTESA